MLTHSSVSSATMGQLSSASWRLGEGGGAGGTERSSSCRPARQDGGVVCDRTTLGFRLSDSWKLVTVTATPGQRLASQCTQSVGLVCSRPHTGISIPTPPPILHQIARPHRDFSAWSTVYAYRSLGTDTTVQQHREANHVPCSTSW